MMATEDVRRDVYRVAVKQDTREAAVEVAVLLDLPSEAVVALGDAWAVSWNGMSEQVCVFAARALSMGYGVAVTGWDGNELCKPGEVRFMSAPQRTMFLDTFSQDEIEAFYMGMTTAALFMTVHTSNVGKVSVGNSPETH
jgi:hypothetical protein